MREKFNTIDDSMLEHEWKLGGQFGDMENILIGMSYHATSDLKSRGF